ncbi:MAG: glycoside hydrolase family 127 protein, partial [Prevotella sp.]|nr:glycoside hydrolase family 127 protein [Prevotella sp.]
INVVSKLSDSDMESMLNWEHGGMNESLLDAYQLFGDNKYLTAAKRFSHKTMLNGMQSLNTTFLDGKHANTQVPKYIGFERIYENDATATTYRNAANNFWNDVANNRTVCIGGNSVNEHFLSKSNGNRYIDQLDGPESCNSNNMLKLSEMMSDRTHDAKYADFYENTMWNHILSTQDPLTGGYVYFTTLRPQGYRIYSQVNQGMWCCVGTGMENHSKYGHFIYTHDGNNTLYVNLFIPSELNNNTFGVRQETKFPYIETPSSDLQTPCLATTNIVFTKAGDYTLAVRHPAWAGEEYKIMVNGEDVAVNVTKGKASYATINRSWKVGDVVHVYLPMELRYEECPNYTDYIAFKFGPILLGAQTTATSTNEASVTGLLFEQLQNVYAGEGRMDHAPGSRASSMSLTKAPLLIGNRANVLDRIQIKDLSQLKFTIDASRPDVASYTWNQLELRPFYDIHHARYMCYWYQQTAENYANSDMAASEAANEALLKRTLDFVAPGEQQSEAGHEYSYSSTSTTGNYNSERYRDAQRNGYIQYTLYNNEGIKEKLSVLCRFTTADKGRMATLYVDGTAIADITIPSSYAGAESNGFY